MSKESIWDAARNGKIEVIQERIADGVDINAIEPSSGCAPIHLASQAGHWEVVKSLVNEKGVDLNAKDNEGSTLLMDAAQYGELEICKWLADEKGADLNAKDNNGWTPLWHAAWYGELEICKWLADEKGADVNAKDKEGRTPLMHAAKYGELEICKWLADEKGADVNIIIPESNNTALHIACSEQQKEVIELLLSKGASLVRKDSDQKTPMDIAFDKGNMEIVKLMLSYVTDKDVLEEAMSVTSVPKIHDMLQTRMDEIDESQAFKEMMLKVAEGNDRISGGESHAILLFGNTGSGKSTLAHVLSNQSLKAFVHPQWGRAVYDTVDTSETIKISHSKKSETKIPNKCFTDMNGHQAVVWDCPGFNDTDIGQNIANSFYIRKLYNQHQNLKLVLVVPAGAIINERGDSFVRTLEQFCNNFVNIDMIKEGVVLVITDVYFATQPENLHGEIKEVLKCHKTLSPDVKKLLTHIAAEKKIISFNGPNILFPKPNFEEVLEQDKFAHIIEEIQEKSKYVAPHDDKGNSVGKFHLSDIAVSKCKGLFDSSMSNLELILNVLRDATKNAAGASGKKGDFSKDIFNENYETIKEWLPAKVNYIRDQQPAMHDPNEFFLTQKHLARLKEKSDLYTESQTSAGTSSSKMTDYIQKFENIITRVESLFNIFEEYALDPELRHKIEHIAYASMQMSEYCKLFSGLIDGKTIQDQVFSQKSAIEMLTQRLTPVVQETGQIINAGVKTAAVNLEVEYIENQVAAEDVAAEEKYQQEAVKLLKLYPGEHECIKKQAQSYYKLGKLKNSYSEGDEGVQNIAVKYYLYALKLDKTLVDAYEDLGDIYASRANYKEAIKFYKVTKNTVKLRECYKILMNDKEDHHIRKDYADMWASFGVYDKAKKYYTDAIGLTRDPGVIKDLMIKRAACSTGEVLAKHAQDDIAKAQANKFYDFDQGGVIINEMSLTGDSIEE